MQPIIGPTTLNLTTSWYNIQHTNLHVYHPKNSQETNKLLKSFGRGSFFVISGFRIGLFKAIVDGKQSCIARLTPGLFVHDFTVIDFVQELKKTNNFIYVKVFDESSKPIPRQVYKIGSRYYHGVMGDGINATPSYSIIQAIRDSDGKKDFRTFYSLELNENYGENGIIDIQNINVTDFRFPPNDTDPTDPEDPWRPTIDYDDAQENNDSEMDYTTLIARSEAIKWSFVFN